MKREVYTRKGVLATSEFIALGGETSKRGIETDSDREDTREEGSPMILWSDAWLVSNCL